MGKILLYFSLLLFIAQRSTAQCDGSTGQCLGTQSYTVDPAPVDGQYNSGTVVTFCYTMVDYNQCNSNWFHTLNLTLGDGWDVSTLTSISVPSGCDLMGNWALYSSSTSTNTGLTFGPCFSYDSPSGSPNFTLDGIPGNNYGDNCAFNTWTFCFSIQVAEGCNGQSLNVDATAIGDGTGGSWSSNTCPGVAFNMCNATCTSCHLQVTSEVTNPTCLDNNGSIILTADSAAGNITYSWQPTGDTIPGLTGLPSGTYSVVIKDSIGCTVKDTFAIGFVNSLDLTTNQENVSCYGLCNGAGYVLVQYGTPPYSYDWSNGATMSVAQALCPGTYYVTVTDSNFCQKFDTVTITSPPFYSDTFSYSPELICIGTTVVFTNHSSGSIQGYLWTFGDGDSSTAVSPTHLYTEPGDYIVTLIVYSGDTCKMIESQLISVHPNIDVNVTTSPPPYCAGVEIQFTDNSIGNPGSWNWNFGDGTTSTEQNPTHAYQSAGTYNVNVTINDLYCGSGTYSETIPVFTIPHPVLPEDTVLCGGEVELLSPNDTASTYLWSTGETTPAINFTMPGEDVTVWVKLDNGGCSGYDSVFFKNHCVMVLPTAFSPNNDGKNDWFRPLGSNVQDFEFVIYNRWGQEMFRKNSGDIHDGWDGTFDGEDQPVGVYVYTLKGDFISGQTFQLKGNFTLVR